MTFQRNAILVALALGASVPALAAGDSTATRNEPAASASRQVTQGPGDLRMSRLIGMTVVDRNDEEIGHVKDLIVSGSDGDVRYAVVDAGGWLGIGDDRTAVPISRVKATRDHDRVRVDMSREQLSRYPAYPPDRHPDWNDAGWRNRVDGAAPAPAGGRQATFYRASELLGAELRDKANQDIGNLEDIVVDAGSGKVRFGIARFDPTYLDTGREVVLRPDQVTPSTARGGDLVVVATRAELRQAPSWRDSR